MSVARVEAVTDRWPEAISDGLTIPCSVCGEMPSFDYTVDSEAWRGVIPAPFRRGVICLSCFDRLARDAGIRTGDVLEAVQFTGAIETVLLVPAVSYRYEDYERGNGAPGLDDSKQSLVEAPKC